MTLLILGLAWACNGWGAQPKALDGPAESRLVADRDAFWAQAQPTEPGPQAQGSIEALGIKLIQAVKDGQTVCSGTYKAGWVPAFEYRFRGALLLQGQDRYPDGALMHRVDLGPDGSRREAFYGHDGPAFLSLDQGPAGSSVGFLGASATAQGWALPDAWGGRLQALAEGWESGPWQLVSWGDWPRLKVQRVTQRLERPDGLVELRLRAEGFSARLPLREGHLQGLVQVAAWEGPRPSAWAAFEAVSGAAEGRSLAVAGAVSPGAASAGSYGVMSGGRRQGPWIEWRFDADMGCGVTQLGAYEQGRRQGLWRERWEGKGYAEEQVFEQGVSVGAKALLRALSPAGLQPGEPLLRGVADAEALTLRFPDGCALSLRPDGNGLLRQAPEPCAGVEWQAPPAVAAPALDPAALSAACLVTAQAGTLQVKLVAQLPDPSAQSPATVSLPQLGWGGSAYQVRREGLWVWDPARLRTDWFSLQGAWQGWREDSDESAGRVSRLEELARLRPPLAPAPWSCDLACAGVTYRFSAAAGPLDDPASALSVTVRHQPDQALLGTVRFLGAWSSGPVLRAGAQVGALPADPSPALGRDDASIYVLTRALGALQWWKLTAFQ